MCNLKVEFIVINPSALPEPFGESLLQLLNNAGVEVENYEELSLEDEHDEEDAEDEEVCPNCGMDSLETVKVCSLCDSMPGMES